MDLIDLHTHTTASDGSLSPHELVNLALKSGLKALAVTDHDTLDGLAQAMGAAKDAGLELVPGVEISVEAGLPGGIHMLGLYLDPDHAGLNLGLKRLQKSRAERNPKIAARLRELGLDITLEEVKAASGGGQLSRAHFAQVLVEKGMVQDRNQAFSRFIGAGKPAYVPKFRLPPDEAAALIKSAGGVPVVAHPGLCGLGKVELEKLVIRLAGQGVEGVEAIYSEHTPTVTRQMQSLAQRLDLVVTGGSDFHGNPKPGLRLGTGKGGLRVPYSLLEPLKQRRDRIRGLLHSRR